MLVATMRIQGVLTSTLVVRMLGPANKSEAQNKLTAGHSEASDDRSDNKSRDPENVEATMQRQGILPSTLEIFTLPHSGVPWNLRHHWKHRPLHLEP